ncbi:hypothetical protein [Chthonobacter rhizosphaerae]|uniref:hypothetical protein n=1 Tax=Chthonobacter rhizosphaerae TaxID=2735553 RepID=UPI0015EE4023|nr:hypothetical protein [Chthonobacter rhizosphaerae]
MIELVLTVCLMTAPEECRQERMPFEGPLISCAMAGQFAAAEWLQTHPKWSLSRWRCGPQEIRT